jgi:hypothetical protein
MKKTKSKKGDTAKDFRDGGKYIYNEDNLMFTKDGKPVLKKDGTQRKKTITSPNSGSFKKGNTFKPFARNGGAPRTTCPGDDELKALGEDLVAWAGEETDELRISYDQWYAVLHGIREQDWELMLLKPAFSGYHKTARALLSMRYKNGRVNPSIAQRFLRLYCPELRKEENETLAYKAELARQKEQEDKDELVRNLAKAIADEEEISGTGKAAKPKVETE